MPNARTRAYDERAAIWDRMTGNMAVTARTPGLDTAYDSLERDYDRLTSQLEPAGPRGAGGVDRTDVVDPRTAFNRDGDTGRSPVLRAGESFTGWARAQGLVPEDHDTGAARPMEFGRYIRGMVTGNWRDADVERAAMRESTSVPAVFNAMSEGVLTGGGYLVPTILSTQLIDLARARARVLAAGGQIVPMANSTVDLARWAGDPTASWHSENTLITPSDAVLSRLRLQAKTLASIVVASRELVEDSTPESLDVALRDAFAAQFAITVDWAALYGSGVAPEPLGIKGTSGVTVTPLGANGAALTSWDPVVNGVFAVRAANEEPNAVIWSPRTAKTAALLREGAGTGQYLAPPAYLDDLPRLETSQVPTNLVVGTSGATTSDVFVGDWRQLLLGVRTELTVGILAERYVEFGQIGFAAWWRGDVGVARPAAFSVTTGVL